MSAYCFLRRAVSGLLLCAVLAFSQSPRSIRRDSEAEVKATFLINFAKFVEWPQESPTDRDFAICVAGDDPFGPALERAVDGELIGKSRSSLGAFGAGSHRVKSCL